MPGPPKKKAKQQSLTSFFTQTDKSSAHLEDPDTSNEIAAVATSVQEKDNIQSESDENLKQGRFPLL